MLDGFEPFIWGMTLTPAATTNYEWEIFTSIYDFTVKLTNASLYKQAATTGFLNIFAYKHGEKILLGSIDVGAFKYSNTQTIDVELSNVNKVTVELISTDITTETLLGLTGGTKNIEKV